MKKNTTKKLVIFTIFSLSIVCLGADTELQDLTELTDIASSDILYILDDPLGTPASRRITALNIFDMIDTSAKLLAILTNETGTGALVFATSPTLVTPILGTITSGVGTALTALNGENIQDDTIDDDSIDFTDVTGADLTLTDCGAITSTGTITATVGFDIVGAADIDYGSADVTDHTFITDDMTLIMNGGITVSTGDFIKIGTTQWNSADEIDGTKIKDADYGDIAIDAGGAWTLSGDAVDENHIADDGIDSEHYNDGSIDLVHLAAGVYAKDLVTTAPITGATDNIFVGADSDVTVALTLLKDIVTTAPITGGEDDVLPGADADLTIAITLAKDLVTTAPVTGGTDNILPGADSDITIALDFTAAWDYSAATLTMPKRTKNDDRYFAFNAWNPNALYDTDTQICIEPNLPAAITITEVTVTLDADPTTELDWDLKWADAFIGFANAALVVAIDTTSGTTDVDSGFNDATVAAGKCLYVEFAADPDSNIKQAMVKIRYDFD